MGVNALATLFKLREGLVKKLDLAIAGKNVKRVAIDLSNVLYKFLYGGSFRPGVEHAYLTSLMNQILLLLENGITPVYVLDGKPTEHKSGEIKKRQEARAQAKERLSQIEEELEATSDEGEKVRLTQEMYSLRQRIATISSSMLANCCAMMDVIGIPHLQAPAEADHLCAALMRTGKVQACISEDMDFLAHAPNMVLWRQFKGAGKGIHVYDVAIAERELGLTHAQFVDICIMCGCDYTDGIYNVAAKSGYKLIQQFGDLENIFNHILTNPKKREKHKLNDDFMSEVKIVRGLFGDSEGMAIPKLKERSVGMLKLGDLEDFLIERDLVLASSTRNRWNRLISGKSKKAKAAKANAGQTSIKSFFGKSA